MQATDIGVFLNERVIRCLRPMTIDVPTLTRLNIIGALIGDLKALHLAPHWKELHLGVFDEENEAGGICLECFEDTGLEVVMWKQERRGVEWCPECGYCERMVVVVRQGINEEIVDIDTFWEEVDKDDEEEL